jgi:anti-sigma B factor antagonist
MNVNHEIKQGVLALHIEGDLLGLSEEEQLLEFVKEHIERNVIFCMVDIAEVGYMNSTGLSLLIRLLTRFRNNGGDMVLIKPSEQVKKLLVITKLNAIFTVVDDEAAALAHLNK